MLAEYKVCEEIFNRNGLDFNQNLYEKLDVYAEFLCEYNQKVNLTAITDAEGIFLKHFLDSILLFNHTEIPENARIIDVGTGAGLPSVPLKLYRDDLNITLLDSLNKRVVFLKELTQKLEIDAECVHHRAEQIVNEESYRESYDISVARAVATLPTLCEYCLPFVKVGGSFIAMKGPNEDISIAKNAIKLLGGKVVGDVKYNLDGLEQRRAIIIKKISHTPLKYPRNSGQIKSNPL
ncbi:MAG TPA: 16S rRNA (guanine(527)-N(7))-methyltransferase RsmG [Clostridiales bacterium]|nr:16S rRNA (guanine(527)-N(7))-methyltransferase RsmG [Clostridiales bacterium]